MIVVLTSLCYKTNTPRVHMCANRLHWRNVEMQCNVCCMMINNQKTPDLLGYQQCKEESGEHCNDYSDMWYLWFLSYIWPAEISMK